MPEKRSKYNREFREGGVRTGFIDVHVHFLTGSSVAQARAAWHDVPDGACSACWSSRDDDGAAAVEAVRRRLQEERTHIRA
jgi:hypothetical protein